MKSSKKIIFAFFISAALMNNKLLLHNSVQAAETTPNPQSSAYTSNVNVFTKYGYKGQCTWFTYGRVLEKLNLSLPTEFYGNAVDWWYANARDKVYSYGTEPKANSIVVWSGGNKGYGHVAFVEKVEGNTVYFTEGNFSVRGDYDGKIKTLSKEEIKKRGNLYLKGYIYLGDGKNQSSNNGTSSNENVQAPSNNEPVINKGTVNISSSSSVLNVRSSGATSSEVIGLLRKGETVNIVGTYGDWYKVKYNSSYGYVSSKYISISGQNTTTPSTSTGNPSSISSGSGASAVVQLKNTSSSLNLRTAPGGNVLTALSHGTKINILETSGSWYKVQANGNIGYVHSDFVSVSQAAKTNTANSTSPDSKIGTVVLSDHSSTLNLRNNPWTGRIVSTLSYGTKVEVLGTNGRWLKVKSGSEVGYVHSDYIKI
ncbi:SH3 domain-containing protein [Clostridium sp. A1-XYC3]|uniref:N-acetylmuramoyl-L-alanine amidase n=1 Tax=Clostridium tanneri TaxID=3037988 RepID=A0ABU4JX93_9CLOT|nr:SH3 domain-containing protein [Clostridium sp. A1-XYC3]MDW8802529.1 SH3 domain-containing protein [Clostridium sp. A1-XYC3]